MSGNINGTVSVITGAGSGIGKSIAMLFSGQGSKVYIVDYNEEAGQSTKNEILGIGGFAEFIHCDISNEESVNNTISLIIEREKQIDILVNNAGVSHIGNIEQTNAQDMHRIFNINVMGAFFVSKAAIPFMIKKGGGVILNMASIVAKVGISERFAYSMSKGAVLSMTLSIAKDYINKNIRCNCICPARVHTPFVDDYLKKNYAGREGEIFHTLSNFQPIGRMGTPDEIAKMALFLCSEDSSFITGATYDVDGGVMNLR